MIRPPESGREDLNLFHQNIGRTNKKVGYGNPCDSPLIRNIYKPVGGPAAVINHPETPEKLLIHRGIQPDILVAG